MNLIAKAFILIGKIWKRVKMKLFSSLFKEIGKNVIFDPSDHFSYKTIIIGDDVFIGSGAKFSSQNESIKIGRKVMFGPNVTIMGGDHNTEQIGKYMFDVKTKLAHHDLPVEIGEDVWIGSNAIILKGVKIGRGSIVGAGSIVTKSCDPYSILVGAPAKVVKKRFSINEISKHEALLI